MSDKYEIRLKGHLDTHWSQWFNGLAIYHRKRDETVLTGLIADQAALHGILAKIRDLGIPLLALKRLHESSAKTIVGRDQELADRLQECCVCTGEQAGEN